MKHRHILLMASVAFLLSACGAGGTTGGSSSQQLVGITVDNVVSPVNLYVTDFGLGIVESVPISSGVLTSFVGQKGAYGRANGNGSAATFNGVEGIALVGSNLYAVDAFNFGVRQVAIASPYTVQTFAGHLGTRGSSDGTGTAATFDVPRNIVADTAGNLFVTDAFNQTIREITPAGVVTTIAGYAGASGTLNGVASAARFNNPWGITIDTASPQNLYVTDLGNNAIRKLTPATSGSVTTWTVSTIAGSIGVANYGYNNATGTNALFNSPWGIASDGNNLYVADAGNNAIRKIVISSGVVTTLAGGGPSIAGKVNGTGTAASFSQLVNLTYANGNLYVIDQNGTSIRVVNTTTGAVTTLF